MSTAPPLLTDQTLDAYIQQIFRHPHTARFVGEIQNSLRQQKQAAHPNPLTRQGRKFFSQNDEDGILREILRRIHGGDTRDKKFIEFGVGNGLENNTLLLVMQGWRGFWVGGEELALGLKPEHGKLAFHQGWINRETALAHYLRGCMYLDSAHIDVFSLDLDGTDLYVAEAILAAGHRPTVMVCEYNGKFPPPIEFTVPYDPKFTWNGSDYFGASLQSYVNLLTRYEYQLIACNITGANAFFVHKPYAEQFSDVPASIDQIFVAADYGFVTGIGHPIYRETIESFL